MRHVVCFTLLLSIVLASCSHRDATPVDHFPFKTEKTDFWGLMGTDGTVLFDGAFMYCPSISSRGVFLVREENGLLSFYTATETPKKLGKDYYSSAKLFLYSDYTPVRKEGETAITIINKKGETMATLPDNIIDVGFFANGLAPFMTDSIAPRMGYIDERGKVRIPAQYLVATNFVCGVALVSYMENDRTKTAIIAPDGKEIFAFNDSIQPLAWEFSDGLLPVANPYGQIGFIGTNGKMEIGFSDQWTLCHPANPFTIPYTFKDGRCIYSDGMRYGLLDRKGRIAVTAQYLNIYLGEGGLFAVENEQHQWGCIDGDGNVVIDFKYLTGEIRPSINPDAIVLQNESGRYKLIDKEGRTLNKLPFSQYQSKYYNL